MSLEGCPQEGLDRVGLDRAGLRLRALLARNGRNPDSGNPLVFTP